MTFGMVLHLQITVMFCVWNRQTYQKLSSTYPNANVKASTFDEFLDVANDVMDQLPVPQRDNPLDAGLQCPKRETLQNRIPDSTLTPQRKRGKYLYFQNSTTLILVVGYSCSCSKDLFLASVLSVCFLEQVVTSEIGDTWLYGVPSDPLKNVWFREISRRSTMGLYVWLHHNQVYGWYGF